MKFFACSFVAALLAFGANAQGVTPKSPQNSVLLNSDEFRPPLAHAWPSSDLGIGSRMFRVIYPGFNAKMPEQEQKESSLEINFYKWDKAPSKNGQATIIHEETVIHSNVSQPTFFTFGIPENKVEQNNWYSVGFCVKRDGQNIKCSEASEPATFLMDIGVGNEIDCNEFGHSPRSIVDITSMTTEEGIRELREKYTLSWAARKQMTTSLKRFVDGTDRKQMIYAAPVYDLKTYKDILEDKTSEFCRRKYQTSLLVHVMNKEDGQVMKIHRSSPFLTEDLIADYITGGNSRPIPMEALIDISDLVKEGQPPIDNYKLQFTVCYDNTLTVGSVRCSKPYTIDMPALE